MTSIPLLATKLHIPAPRLQLVDRPQLWDALDSTSESPLTVVSAPAGSGKTVTLATWVKVRAGAADTAWLSLESAENDPVRFWLYVLEALRMVEPSLVVEASRKVAEAGRDPAGVVTPLVHALTQVPRRVLLVLDDYHTISDDGVHRSVNFLLNHLPPSARLVVASRALPPLNLPTRLVRGELTLIGSTDLRFSVSEAATLLAGMSIDVGSDALERILDRTEGWAAGLYLAALSLSQHPDTEGFVDELAASDVHVFEFLAFEVLERQSPQVQAFLRRTSILSELSAELCDAVLGTTGSQPILEQIEQANLFLIPLDSRRRWYRYHHLFGELLRLELDRLEGGLSIELHGRAGEWYREHGDVDTAIAHFTAARRHGEAIDLILANARTRFHSGQWMTVQQWIEALPPDVVKAEPRLAVAMGWAVYVEGMLTEAMTLALAAHEGDPDLVLPGDGLTLAAEVQLLLALTRRSTGDFDGALAAATKARELTDGSGVPRRFVAHAALGMAKIWAGEPGEARTDLEEALPQLVGHRDRLALAELMTLGHLAALEFDAGHLERAGTLCESARSLARERNIERCHLAALSVAVEGRLATRAGRWSDAGSSIDEALALAEVAGDPGPIVYSLVSRALLLHGQGYEANAKVAVAAARVAAADHHAPGLRRLIETAAAELRRPWAGASLTDRELDILRLLPTTKSRREIAQELYISVETVKTHSRGLYRKLGVTTRAEAVAAGRELGLLADFTQGE